MVRAELCEPAPVRCCGLLLTGGASSRFGSDKASARFEGATLAERAARVLEAVTEVAVEVGPGVSGLPSVRDGGAGPLAAVAAGLGAVRSDAPVLLLACDLPLVGTELLGWLAGYPAAGSVVPLAGARLVPQPLCSRWSPAALGAVASLVAGGERSLRPLVAGSDVTLVHPRLWKASAGGAGAAALDDADTPAALERLRRISRRHSP